MTTHSRIGYRARRAAAISASIVPLAASALSIPPTAHTATLPPRLVTLERQMGQLKIASLRFSARMTIAVPHRDRKYLKLLELFGLDSPVSGDISISPPASNITWSYLGHPLTLRLVGGSQYAHIRALGGYDHGRPWVRMSQCEVDELFTPSGQPEQGCGNPSETTATGPQVVEHPFVTIDETLAGARYVREVGDDRIDGRTVTTFLAALKPSQLVSKGLASLLPLRPKASPSATFQVSFRKDGLPVRTVISERESGLSATLTIDFLAINFPLLIEAPPSTEVTDVATLRHFEEREVTRAERRSRHRNRPHHR